MSIVVKIINRVAVIEFYKENAAFFGLILLVFFGFIKSSEHIAIGTFLVINPVALILLFLFWLTYLLKVVFFMVPTFIKRENQFLETYLILDKKLKFLSAFSCSVNLLIPVLSYAIFLISLAFTFKLYTSIFFIIGFSLTLIFSLAYFIHLQLSSLPHEKKVFQIRIFKKITIPSLLFFPSYMLRKEIILLLLTKFYGCLLVIGTAALYRTDSFDLRLLTTGILLATIGNVAIMHKYVWFQYQPMVFSMNLPFRLASVIFKDFANIFLILVPETLVLIRHYPLQVNVFDFVGLFLLAIGICFFIFSWMIIRQVELSEFLVVLFWLVVGITFLILFSVHPMILGAFLLVISTVIIYFRHDQYEHCE